MAGGELIASGYRDASFFAPSLRRRAGCGWAAPVRLPPQVGAGDDLGQDAQTLPHGVSLLRRVNRGRRVVAVGRTQRIFQQFALADYGAVSKSVLFS